MNDTIKTLLQTKPKAGAVKSILYSPLTVITKDNVRPGSCWSKDILQP